MKTIPDKLRFNATRKIGVCEPLWAIWPPSRPVYPLEPWVRPSETTYNLCKKSSSWGFMFDTTLWPAVWTSFKNRGSRFDFGLYHFVIKHCSTRSKLAFWCLSWVNLNAKNGGNRRGYTSWTPFKNGSKISVQFCLCWSQRFENWNTP